MLMWTFSFGDSLLCVFGVFSVVSFAGIFMGIVASQLDGAGFCSYSDNLDERDTFFCIMNWSTSVVYDNHMNID